MIETNRGCPFSCTFCIQGLDWYTKVNHFQLDRMKAEIEYIARRIKAVCPNFGTLRIADSNYGMFERDVDISAWIGEMQKRYGYPTFIDATTGKNRADRIIRSVEKVSGALVVYQAVQSLNEDVLRNIKRSNIKLDTYQEVMIHIRGRGLRSNSDLIVGLPGETLHSHTDTIHKLIDAGTNSMHNAQLILLKGSELEMEESRKKFNFQTRFRVLPKNFGVYGGEKVMDIEEVVISTDTMSFDDYIETRKWHLVSSVFYNDSWYEDAVAFAQKLGLKRSQWFTAMLGALENSNGPAREFLDSFVAETKGELFPAPEACVDFYTTEENFRRLLNGDVGDNLMYKYRAIASFRIWPHVCKAAMDTTRRMLKERGAPEQIPEFDAFWKDLHTFVQYKHADGQDKAQILSPIRVTMSHDIPQWIADGMPLEISRYKLSEPALFEFKLSEMGARELKAALEVWTTSLKGLTKMVTRIQTAWQRRQATPLNRAAPAVKVAVAAAGVAGGLLPEQW
jgi:hypothetical protein